MNKSWNIVLARRDGEGREDGFTLVELLVVLAIIAMLATLIGPRVIGYLGGARADSASFQLRNLSNAVELYRLSTGVYPTQEDGLNALLTAPAGAKQWTGPYVGSAAALKDPWGRPYIYTISGDSFRVSTLGRDGSAGGSGEDADLTTDAAR